MSTMNTIYFYNNKVFLSFKEILLSLIKHATPLHSVQHENSIFLSDINLVHLLSSIQLPLSEGTACTPDHPLLPSLQS